MFRMKLNNKLAETDMASDRSV